jgi:SAM-dependent methyltransferase
MSSTLLDPVVAYDRLAPFFDRVAQRRSRYLASVEGMIVARIPTARRSLLDVGAGDGKRALRIARAAAIPETVLLEPSAQMTRTVEGRPEIWAVRAEDLDAADPRVADRRFDVITCLWNVLGHIRPEAARVGSLREMGRLLTDEGRLFVDVNHRYNVRSYGVVRTLVRLIGDRLSPGEYRGDVTVTWAVDDGETCSTWGHVFTDREIRGLAARAGLVVEDRVVVDYDSGQARRWACLGNLLYVFQRPPSAAPSSGRRLSAPSP